LLAAAVPALAAAAPAIARSWFASLCHQVPERCFASASGPHALCARCEGLYAGGALALAFAAASARFRLKAPHRALWIAVAPTALDVAVRALGGSGLDSAARFTVALPAGVAAGCLLVIGLVDVSLWWTERSSPKPAPSRARRGGTLAENQNG